MWPCPGLGERTLTRWWPVQVLDMVGEAFVLLSDGGQSIYLLGLWGGAVTAAVLMKTK